MGHFLAEGRCTLTTSLGQYFQKYIRWFDWSIISTVNRPKTSLFNGSFATNYHTISIKTDIYLLIYTYFVQKCHLFSLLHSTFSQYSSAKTGTLFSFTASCSWVTKSMKLCSEAIRSNCALCQTVIVQCNNVYITSHMA